MITAIEIQNNFGRYLNLVMSGQEIIVTKNGREVGRFIPKDAAVSYLTDSLTGILKEDHDLDAILVPGTNDCRKGDPCHY